MNLPNKLTLGRVFFAFLFLAALVSNCPYSKNVALLIFVLAALTDYVDGVLARKYHLETNFGKLMDPLADKILIAAALISFIAIDSLLVPAWMVVLVIAREFSVSGMRTLAATQGIILSATRSGKHKLASQVVFVTLMLLGLSLREWGGRFPSVWPEHLDLVLSTASWWLMLVVVVYALISGIDFFIKNAKTLFKEI